MRVIELREEQDSTLPKGELDEKIAVTISRDFSRYITISFPTPISDQYILRPQGYIGQVPITEDVLLSIMPKVSTSNVFFMLEYAYKLRSFKFLKGIVELGSIDNLVESLASVLAKMVLDRNRKGFYRDYVLREEKLPYVKGKIRFINSLRSAIRGYTGLDCEYTENTADVIENRILAWTLYRIPRLSINRDDVRSQVNMAYRAIANNVEVCSVESLDCINRFYHRLNDDYRPMHALCRFFLENSAPMMGKGDHELMPFVLYMPNLFETFVAEWLRANLPPDIELVTKFKVELDDYKNLSFSIDMILKDAASEKVMAALDTKYKIVESPGTDDISQIVSYAVGVGTNKAFLVYPVSLMVPYEFKVGDINGCCLSFDISKDIGDSGHQFLETLVAKLKC